MMQSTIKRKLKRSALIGLVLIVAWIVIVEVIIQPEISIMHNASLPQLLKSWLSLPLAVLLLGLGLYAAFSPESFGATTQAQIDKPSQAELEAKQAAEQAARQRFTLDVMGLGVSIEKFRQRQAYDALQAAPGTHGSVLPQDPKAYAWNEDEKYTVSGKRSDDALEHAASWFVWKWPIPIFAIGPVSHAPDNVRFLTGSPSSAGMHWHTFVWLDTMLDPMPDLALAKIFDFFDRNPQVPAILVMAQDGQVIRDIFRAPGMPSMVTSRDHQKSDPTETITAFILAKRERVDQCIRPWVLPETEKQSANNALDKHYLIAR
ncbi:MAG: type VI lipase adapter Tla3 domain-containing protein, partial [Gammaproteobacteria bacterium]